MKLFSKFYVNLFVGLSLVLAVSACSSEKTDSAPTPDAPAPFDPTVDASPTPVPNVQLASGINLFTFNCTNPAVNSTCVVASKEVTVEVFIDDGNGGGGWFLLDFGQAVKTDSTGRLKIGLEPGHYRISAKDVVVGGPAAVEKDITEDTFINLTLKWDI